MKKIIIVAVFTFTILLATGYGIKKTVSPSDSNSNTLNSNNTKKISLVPEAISSVSEAKSRLNPIGKTEAMEAIQINVTSMVENKEISDSKGTVIGLFEIYIEDAFEKMELQAFAAISDNGFIGCFLVRKGVASYVGGSLNNTCVADIDNDGTYELLTLYGWGSGIYRIELTAYEYKNPIYFNSLTEIPLKEYYSCFIPENGYAELSLKKVNDTTVKLIGQDVDYGVLKTEGSALVVEDMEKFPFELWSAVYNQDKTNNSEKQVPAAPPVISISIDGLSIDYTVKATKWDGKSIIYNNDDAFKEIMGKEQFIPTYNLGSIFNDSLNLKLDKIEDTLNTRAVNIDFGNCLPEAITVQDYMLDQNGHNRYSNMPQKEVAVAIYDNSRIEFGLSQPMEYFLSSDSRDYIKNWYRLFRITCKWGEKECVYVFMVNTGNTEILTELPNNNFLVSEGLFSELSSDWGIGINVNSDKLPSTDPYYIEWQVSGGRLRKWSEKDLKPVEITDSHNGYPITFTGDENKGAVIWTPITFLQEEVVTIRANLFESAEDKSPIASSELIITNDSGTYQEKK